MVTAFSNTLPQEQGVPQGSVLSCTLFLLSMNDVTSSLPEGVSATGYIDDLAIYLTSSFPPSACRILQRAINRIEAWAKERDFMLAPIKTYGCMFHRKRPGPDPPLLQLYNHQIEFKSSVRFLGMTLDTGLRWRT